jgi:hypothetical protein
MYSARKNELPVPRLAADSQLWRLRDGKGRLRTFQRWAELGRVPAQTPLLELRIKHPAVSVWLTLFDGLGFNNLLSNALKFSPKGGTIRVHLREEAGRAVFEVSDEGRGISQEFLPYVLQMFRQAVPATKRGEGDLGIGLAMVKNLSELHGGGVEVESAGEGRGATFRVFLPLQQSGEFASPEAEATAGADGSLTALRVLLVDDIEDALESLRFLLEQRRTGFSVPLRGRTRSVPAREMHRVIRCAHHFASVVWALDKLRPLASPSCV